MAALSERPCFWINNFSPAFLDLRKVPITFNNRFYLGSGLSESLAKNTSLTCLDFTKNSYFTAAHLHTLFDTLEAKNTTLKTLNIYNIKNDEKDDLETYLKVKGLSERVKLHPLH